MTIHQFFRIFLAATGASNHKPIGIIVESEYWKPEEMRTEAKSQETQMTEKE